MPSLKNAFIGLDSFLNLSGKPLGRLQLRDNKEIFIDFQYYPQPPVKYGFTRNIDERSIYNHSDPVNWDVSAGAPTFDFSMLFNSYKDPSNTLSNRGSHLGTYYSASQSNTGSIPDNVILALDSLLAPELIPTARVWLLDIGAPLDMREVLIDSFELELDFQHHVTMTPRMMMATVKGRLHFELPDPQAVYRKPVYPKKKVNCRTEMVKVEICG
ncbi:MAG: hypothetical protein UY48_C0012G0010 [Candidatus Gottesmanbacteria bacterium GW2011_GWB1_49_7]|uniref:Uncharacterized protein n=1 Tax=Candidatus Gottesmanbacteria bacterium GW2011_GWB1_49_7 TaxID=1618448 RepID=A0A0G1W150_9BACT|nr:MAG: hypothetical protein UY48_C0012G0010 [Candidatus Gottesmanbacteria bacterium GW2011_GWB1_49_7]